MRVVLLNHNVARRGGTFWRVLEIGKALVRAGDEATIITTSSRARWRISSTGPPGLEIVEMPALLPGGVRSGFDPVDLARRLQWSATAPLGQVDVIHAFDCRPNVILPALVLRRRTGAALVIDWADWWGRGGTIEERHSNLLLRAAIRPLETYFEEAFRTRADATTVISTALARRAEALGVKPESITILRQGCNPEAITPQDLTSSRRACDLPQGVPIVGYLGALLPKDADLLMRLFVQVQQRLPAARLLLIGNPRTSLPKNDGIIEAGFISQERLASYLGSCNLFLLPLTESIANRARWPSKINSYFSAGRAVVASPVGDVAEAVTRWDVGRLGLSDDGSFRQACCELLSDPAEAMRLGSNARRLAETTLSWSQIVEELLSVYRSALRSRAVQRVPS
jgi:glycosyltransferase involved in cell wall biosynthesis